MRVSSELRKILSIANIVLLAILGYMLVSSIFGSGEEQESAANLEPKAAKAEINLGEHLLRTGNPRIILERNIFSSSGVNTVKKELQKDQPVAQSPKPSIRKQLKLRLLGTVAGDEEVACAVIEDIGTKIQDLYKTGDVIQGARIERIERNRIILLNEDAHEVLDLYVASSL